MSSVEKGALEEERVLKTFNKHRVNPQLANGEEYYLDDLLMNVKLYLMGYQFSEQDCLGIFNHKNHYLRFFIQSKDYNHKIGLGTVSDDDIKTFRTFIIGEYLANNTILVEKKQTSRLLEAKIKRKYGVKILTQEDFNEKYYYQKNLGNNFLSFKRLTASNQFVEVPSIYIGEFYLLNSLNGFKFKNVINIHTIQKGALDTLDALIKYISNNLMFDYFLYHPTTGIHKLAKDYLSTGGIKVISINELDLYLTSGELLSKYEPISKKVSDFKAGAISLRKIIKARTKYLINDDLSKREFDKAINRIGHKYD